MCAKYNYVESKVDADGMHNLYDKQMFEFRPVKHDRPF